MISTESEKSTVERNSAERINVRRPSGKQRREDRREAAERKARLDERFANLCQPQSSTEGRTQYHISAALQGFRPFDGAIGADGATYLMELTRLMRTHAIPVDMWPRELSLQLVGSAKQWYASQFPGLPAGAFPPWRELYSPGRGPWARIGRPAT